MRGTGRRSAVLLLLMCVSAGHVQAQSPPLDTSAGLFAGEWIGTGAEGSYCYVKLSADGWGSVLVDGGSGDWMASRFQWHNDHQALLVDKVVPVKPSPALRVMRLDSFALGGGFNSSLQLTWKGPSAGCALQRMEATAARLGRARDVVNGLQSAAGSQR